MDDCEHTEVTFYVRYLYKDDCVYICDQCEKRVYPVPVEITGGGIIYSTTKPKETGE